MHKFLGITKVIKIDTHISIPKVIESFENDNIKLFNRHANHQFFKKTLIGSHRDFNKLSWKNYLKQRILIMSIVTNRLFHELNNSDLFGFSLPKFDKLDTLKCPLRPNIKTLLPDIHLTEEEILSTPFDHCTKEYCFKILDMNTTELVYSLLTYKQMKTNLYNTHHQTFCNIYDQEYNVYSVEHNKELQSRLNIFNQIKYQIKCENDFDLAFNLNHSANDLEKEYGDSPFYKKTIYKMCEDFLKMDIEFLDKINERS